MAALALLVSCEREAARRAPAADAASAPAPALQAPVAAATANEEPTPQPEPVASPTEAAIPAAKATPYPPRDECAKLPGFAAFRDRLFAAAKARDAEAFAALAGLGCAVDKGVATLPWIFARVPESADPYKTMWVTGEDVRLRAKAAASAPGKARLEWALVTLAGDSFDPKAAFAEVLAADRSRGFVETAKLRSILDYRLIADRSGGEWKITALIAGD